MVGRTRESLRSTKRLSGGTSEGDDVKWRYKATGCSPDYQFRLYQPGEFESQKDYVVANIWDWDWTYTVNWYEDGVLKGAMQAFDDEDQDYINMVKGKKTGLSQQRSSFPCTAFLKMQNLSRWWLRIVSGRYSRKR